MKKINGLVLSTLTAALLVGCGGGSSTSSSSTSTTKSVTVERGAVVGATVKDSSNPPQEGKSSSNNNVYEFENDVVYPIVVSGGFIDVDGDGEASHGDYITQEMSPIVPNERQENTILNVERVFSDSIPLVSGGVSFPEGVELTEESVMTIRLLDSTDPEGHFLVIEESLDELTELPTEYQLFGELPTKRAQYALEISYDSDGDGVADLKSDTVSVLTFGEDDVLDLSLEFISDEDEVDD